MPFFGATSVRLTESDLPSPPCSLVTDWAAIGLRTTNPLAKETELDENTKETLQLSGRGSLGTWLDEKRKLWTFKVVLVFIDIGFLLTKVRQVWIRLIYGKEEGFEDLLQQQVAQMAKEEFGMELDDSAFAG